MIKALSMQNEKSDISIIIPALNSPRLPNTLEALACQTSLDLIREIIVVGQQEITEYPSFLNILNIHVKERPTPAHNRNVGAQSARGSWLVFTDSDCLPRPDWIEKLAGAFSTTYKVIAGSVDVQPDMSYWGQCDHY
jgi:glycosyltransferase involved in cell wall biosynthesis